MAALAVSAASAIVSAASPLSVAVIGGSIGGLAAATAFIRLGASVRVFEQAPGPFVGRGGSIGYCDVGLWQRLRGARMIRRGVQASRAQGAFIYGDLWQFWYEGLPKGTVTFGTTVTDLGSAERPTINGETFDLAVIADGGWSRLRARYFGPDEPEYAGYQVWRFRVDASAVPNFAAEGMYSATDGSHYDTILLGVAGNDGRDYIMGGTAVACPEEEVVRPGAGVARQLAGDATTPAAAVPSWFLPFYREKFGQYARGELYRVMEAAARVGKISALPQYEFAARRVVSGRLVLIGDAAHMASPRTASGAHTAVLDAAALYEAFRPAAANKWVGGADVVDAALAAYEPSAINRAQSLYARSLEVSAPMCAPGWRPRLVGTRNKTRDGTAIKNAQQSSDEVAAA